MAEDFWIDRGRGILTKRDREFLSGNIDEELSENAQYQKRYQIRDRVKNSMYDFRILYHYLPNRDIWMLWDQTDNWIHRAQSHRRHGESLADTEIPELAKAWRDIIAFFVYSQISTGIPEAETLVEWVIQEGVNKAVRRHTFESYQMYRDVDASLDWGIGNYYKLMDYLNQVERQMPKTKQEAKEYLQNLHDSGYLQQSHLNYLVDDLR